MADFTLSRDAAGLPEAMAAHRGLFESARQAGYDAVLTLLNRSPEAVRATAKRRHDLKGAIRTLGFATDAIEKGYTFSDDKAQAKIDAMKKALKVLERESELLVAILENQG